MSDRYCDDCAGYDIEGFRTCKKHGTQLCRGCSCPVCDDEAWDDYEEDGPMDLEDRLDALLNRPNEL